MSCCHSMPYLVIQQRRAESETSLTCREFEHRAMAEAGVALLSGAAFGEFGEGYVRLSYANSRENIKKAPGRLDRFVRAAA